jgi:uncharacterized protein YbjT (DUF2867 family)
VFVSVLDGSKHRTRVPQIEARELVVDRLRAGDSPWTLVRSSGFYNDMSEILEIARKGHVRVPGGGARFNPLHGANLAEVCLDLIGDESAVGREVPVGGPDCLTMREVGELAFEALGRSPRISEVPLWMLNAIGATIQPFNVNLANLVLVVSALASGGACCETFGTHRLRGVLQRDR